jgi:5-methylcytosine-specific restriction endonuclease McrA
MSVPCPTCGKDFAKEKSMKIHHAKKHGESIAGEKTVCTWCGESFRKRTHRLERVEKPFCSPDCQASWRSENFNGEDNPAWNGGKVEVECETCGDAIYRIQARADSYDRHFCGSTCMGAWTSQTRQGPNHPNWEGGRVQVECEYCGDEVERHKSRLQRHDQTFCDSTCKGDWLAENTGGPDWEGGYYGRIWKKQRAKAVARDDHVCQLCGITGISHAEKYGIGFHVHHIIPIAKFDELEEAHQLSNLTTLCASCHGKIESGIASLE